jgi:uncharacterized protein
MPLFAVIREPGPGWDPARPLREQDGWDAHAVFMDALADEGLIVMGGPVGENGRTLLIFDAKGEQAIRGRLDADPWTPTDHLRVASVEPWTVLLGTAR